ncbi:MAG: TonB-dependent receptor [Myxococcales bacterium]|nr:TonB-dependent receptor [Myxococcales bacterium]
MSDLWSDFERVRSVDGMQTRPRPVRRRPAAALDSPSGAPGSPRSAALATGLLSLVFALGAAPDARGEDGDPVANAAPAGRAHTESSAGPDPFAPGVESIVVFGRADEQIGIATAGSEGRVARADLELRPLGRVGELLEMVPGLIATQHSGPGKSNQLFLRGFNLDHGTDFAAHFDGVPINLRTHGHGQGYLDLNFVIPELVESMDFRKGPYRADVGDFASAGSSFMRSYDVLPHSFASLTIGQDAFVRGLSAANVEAAGGDVILALEAKTFDDPYDLDADLLHINAFAKLTRPLGAGTLRASALGYHAEWTSTDQVPRRAIDSPDPAISIPRLGYVDPDLGGETTRVGTNFEWVEDGEDPLRLSTWLLYYRLKLFSNFTYFLDDPPPGDGDEFAQRDERVAWGARATKHLALELAGRPFDFQLGSETRLDVITDVGLFQTAGRARTGTVRRDDVHEWSGAVFSEARFTPFDWMTWMVGVRGDLYVFDVDARDGIGAESNSGTELDGLVSPKLALILRPHEQLELYLNGGGGFHSNDARGTTIAIDPSNGAAVDPVDPLARQWGAELGARWQPDRRFHVTSALWFLTSQSELVFVGDAGTTEPSGSSRRFGVELSAFLQPFRWLALDASYAWSDARFDDLPRGQDRIPGAIEQVVSAGATVTAGDWSGSLRVRHFGAYPLVEDDTQRASSTTLVNLGANYDWGPLRLGLTVINLFDSKDADIQYYYASQLATEATPQADVHLHPAMPRQVRGTATLRF